MSNTARPIDNLAYNENPHGMSDGAKQAVINLLDTNKSSRYPNEASLTKKLAKLHSVGEANVVLGNGSNQILNTIAQVFLSAGQEAVSSQYSFLVYRKSTELAGAEYIEIPANNFGYDLTAIEKAVTNRTRLIWIANPNNPTGTYINHDDLKAFIGRLPKNIVIVLDEAYQEFLNHNNRSIVSHWLEESPQVIVVRTFSKAYGMAGLRVGYAFASTEVVKRLKAGSLPYTVNAMGLVAAEAALDDVDFINMTYESNSNGMKQITGGLSKLGIKFLPSCGNFVTFKISDTQRVLDQLKQRGVLVRSLDQYDLPGYLRVTVGLKAENDHFLASLSEIISS
ncbi:histidinol-phosphate transaminase [Candidatus Saccharibacteria bacterium]|nr:histidinol-phosphate transaminase [Candidatus Saccharibacteria bacterium]